MAGWKVALSMMESDVAWDDVLSELRRYYKTACSLKTAASRARVEYRLRHGKDLRHARAPPHVVRACVQETAQNLMEKNKRPQRVDGDALLTESRAILERGDAAGKYELILALLFVSGRRTIEIVNNRSSFRPIARKPYAATFRGQAKTRHPRPVRIPLLVPFRLFSDGLDALRRKQRPDTARLTHRELTHRYQSGLGQYFSARAPFNTLRRVHDLRGAYAMVCYTALERNGDNPDLPAMNWVVVNILGDSKLANSLSYAPYRVELRGTVPLGAWKF